MKFVLIFLYIPFQILWVKMLASIIAIELQEYKGSVTCSGMEIF